MDNALSFLGILNKAGKLRIGENCLHSHRPSLLLLASDCSKNSEKSFLEFVATSGIDCLRDYTKNQLGQPIGYSELTAILIEGDKEAKAFKGKLAKNR